MSQEFVPSSSAKLEDHQSISLCSPQSPPPRTQHLAGEKTNESLPSDVLHHFQAKEIKEVLRSVIKHYGFPICCLALETQGGMSLTGNYGIDVKFVDHHAERKSILRHDVNRNLPIIIYDATQDARFTHDPLVVGPPFVRFFIGVPIMISPIKCIGTLCLMHQEPRQFFSLNDCRYAMQAAGDIVQHFVALGAASYGTITLGSLGTFPTMSTENSLPSNPSSPGTTPPTTPRA